MLVGIHQLHYLPWLRYFEKILRADCFIVLDNIQFNKNGWQNRNQIKTAEGALLLTVPVLRKAAQSLDEVRINNAVPWRKKHWRSIEQAYARAPYFRAYAPALEAMYQEEYATLNALNRRMLTFFLAALGSETRIEYASRLGAPGKATERLVQLIKAVGGDCYYSGAYALEVYLDADALRAAGIDLRLQAWTAPRYTQLHGEFIPDLSILDLLLNHGPASARILLEGQA